jgi:Zn-dependent protease with chaperone function
MTDDRGDANTPWGAVKADNSDTVAQEPEVFVDYFDGETPTPRRVELRFEGVFLSLTPSEGTPVRWHLADLRRVPDQAGGTEKAGVVLALIDGSPQRLYIPASQPHLADAIAFASPAKSAPPPVPGMRKRLLGLSLAAVASVALILFVLIPVMADQLARFLPPDGEKALGDVTFEQIRVALDQDGGDGVRICELPEGQQALEKMTARLAKHTTFPYPLTVHVLEHQMVNAFALPGGHVVLFSGLIEAAETPEEVAAVLAHEMGHVAARDPARGALRSAGSIGVLGLVFGDFAGGTVALFLANQLIEASYSQSAETAADVYATDLMVQAGLPPEALGVFFQRLRDLYGDQEGLVQHFSTHPALRDRVQAAAEAGRRSGAQAQSPVLSRREWQALRRICP